MDTNEDAKRRTRRRHDDGLKRQVLIECAVPGASVAKVAMAHGLNANLVHKWRRELQAPTRAATFVPVAVASKEVSASMRQALTVVEWTGVTHTSQ